MKHIKKFNESLDNESTVYFERAMRGSASVPDDFHKIASKYHIYDNIYLYDDEVFIYSSRPSGDWYHTEISLSDKPIKHFIDEFSKKIDLLEKAIYKLENGSDDV
jgi:hypothetical protein